MRKRRERIRKEKLASGRREQREKILYEKGRKRKSTGKEKEQEQSGWPK